MDTTTREKGKLAPKATRRTGYVPRTEVEALTHAARTMHATLRLGELYSIVPELIATLTDSTGAVLLLHRPRTHHPVIFKLWRRDVTETVDLPAEVGGKFIEWLAAHGEDSVSFPTPNPEIVSAIAAKTEAGTDIACWIPLVHRTRVSGAIGVLVDSAHPGTRIEPLLRPLAEQAAVALENAVLYRQIERQSLETKSLLQATQVLSGSLDFDEVLAKIMDSLNAVLPYDAGGIFLVNSEGQIEKIVDRGYAAESEFGTSPLEKKARQGLVGWVAANGETVIVNDVTKDERYQRAREQTRSEIVVPILADGRILGVFNIERDIPHGFYEADIDLIAGFAQQAGVALERARNHTAMLEQRRIKGELEVAKTIQQSFLPDDNPRLPGLDVAGLNIPSAEVGGDYYDFIDIIDGQIGVAIADVAGKGVPAALIMATFRASLIAEIRNNYALRSIMQKVNRLLCERNEGSRFVTAIYGVLDVRNRIFTFSNAGHNPGILRRADGTIIMLKEGGTALGLFENATFDERALGLMPGDLIFLYTDGVTDTVGRDGTMFEMERLIELVHKAAGRPAAEIVKMVETAIDEFADHEQSQDDLTMLVICVQ